MRLALDPRARRLLRRVPRGTIFSAMELVLLSLLAVQCARLVWAVVTPVGPIGDWKTESALRPPPAGQAGALARFDPFFRLSASNGPVVVTALDLKLFGVRQDRASGRGSAIISTPDGQQRSFAVGEEIVPGVTLAAVGFDNVTISRGGAAEQLFLDQSPPANAAASADEDAIPYLAATPAPTPAPVVVPAPAPAPTAGPASNDFRFEPRMNGGTLQGVTLQPRGSGDAFRAAGLAPGDVVMAVDGQRITSADQARSLAGRFSGRNEVILQVERDGRVIPLRVRPGQ